MNFQTSSREELELNITPLIDIVFLLLIFFMVSTTFQTESQLRVQLPEATDQPAADRGDPLEIVVSAEGQYAVAGRDLGDNQLQTLIAALRDAAGGDLEQPLVVRADARAPHQAVVRAMDASSRVGLRNLSIATSRPDGSQSRESASE